MSRGNFKNQTALKTLYFLLLGAKWWGDFNLIRTNRTIVALSIFAFNKGAIEKYNVGKTMPYFTFLHQCDMVTRTVSNISLV
jgi:hypothetical protein